MTGGPDREAARCEGRRRAAALRERARRLRRRAVAGTAALFLALFAGITVQMATGNDPGLQTTVSSSASQAAATASTSSSATTSTDHTTSTEDTTSTDATTQSNSDQSSSSDTELMTSQS